MPEESNNIEIRSDEVQEILGYIPPKYIRYGIGVITSCVIVLIVGTWFFKYPDIVTGRIELVTESPAVEVKSMATGKVENIFVKDFERVKQFQVLALIENVADFNDINELKEKLKAYRMFLESYDIWEIPNMDRIYSLGSVQEYYSVFNKVVDDYKQFVEIGYNSKKIISIKKEINEYKLYINSLENQCAILADKLRLANSQYDRDSALYKTEVISLLEWQNTKSNLIEVRYAFEGTKTNKYNAIIQLAKYEQQLFDLETDERRKLNDFKVDIKSSYETLLSKLKDWKHKYVVRSPIAGKVSFTKIWSNNQNIKSGDIVFTIIPMEKNIIKGRVSLSMVGSGKVKVGQIVNIKLDNYPYMEYGMIKGKVESISLTTNENKYIVEVALPELLKTNYGEKILFKHKMQGSVEIITKDMRLLYRLLSPLKYLLDKVK